MAKIDELKFDDKNFNKHTQFGLGLLEKSLRNNGAGRSILIDKHNNIIAGNGVVEVAGQIGLDDVQIVESDGTKIIAVKRTDIDINSKQGREMALADNAVAHADLDWDPDALAEVTAEFDINVDDWGVALNEQTEESEPYTMKIEPPVYEVKGEKPQEGELYDSTKAEQLKADIEKAKLPKDVKQFLLHASERHVKFNFGKIAEYYCHATAEVQRLMEDSALVIIDFDKAIADGYVKLREEIRELMCNDRGIEQ